MRTTIVIDDSLGAKLRVLASKKGLSDFVNQCLREHFGREEKARRMAELEKAYLRASKKRRGSEDFNAVDVEDWPEW